MEDGLREAKPSTHSYPFWSDFDSSDAHAAEKVIKVRDPQDSLYVESEVMPSDFQQKIDSYQIQYYSEQC
jgi:hypothetical protein